MPKTIFYAKSPGANPANPRQYFSPQPHANQPTLTPVRFGWAGSKSEAWLVFSHDAVKRVLSDHERFSSDTAGGGLPSKWGSRLHRLPAGPPLEARVALKALLDTCADLTLADDKPWEPRKAFHVHGPNSLPVRFKVHKQVTQL